MADPKYEHMLQYYLDKSENNKGKKKNNGGGKPVLLKMNGNNSSTENVSSAAATDRPKKHMPKPAYNPHHYNNRDSTNHKPRDSPDNPFVRPKDFSAPSPRRRDSNSNGSVKETLEKLFAAHSSMINVKLNTIVQKVQNFSADVQKLKTQQHELQKTNEMLWKMLLESKSQTGNMDEVKHELDKTFDPLEAPKTAKATGAKKKQPKITEPSKTETDSKTVKPSTTTHELEVSDLLVLLDADEIVKVRAEILRKRSVPDIPEYEKLLSLQEEKIIYARDSFTCDNCSELIIDSTEGDGVILQQCGHTYCRQCIGEHVYENKYEHIIQCPSKDCEGFMRPGEIEALLTETELQERQKKEMSNIKGMNLVTCQTKGCDYAFDVEKGVYDFTCRACKKVNCLDCKKIHADGLTCRKLADLSEEEKLMRMKNWEEINNDALVANTVSFECMVCYIDIDVGEGVVLKSCLHNFCRDCLIRHITTRIDEMEDAIIKCPHGDGYTCSVAITDREIKALVTPETYDKFVGKSLKIAESLMKDKVHCMTPDCEYFCAITDYPNFTCPICEELNCLDCKALHTDKTCKQHQEDLLEKTDEEKRADIAASEVAMQDLVAQGKAMVCPNCGAHAMKEIGCDAIVCRCKTELCWATKMTRWGPRTMVAQGTAMICPNCGAQFTKIDGCDQVRCRCGVTNNWGNRRMV